MVKQIMALFFLVFVWSNTVFAAQYEIRKGEIVSAISLKLTGSANYRREGIKVVTDKGREISRARFDHVQPRWRVVIDDKLVKNVQVKDSMTAGKTLAQVCQDKLIGTASGCVKSLARTNGIAKRRLNAHLSADARLYARPGLLAASSVVAAVEQAKPAVIESKGQVGQAKPYEDHGPWPQSIAPGVATKTPNLSPPSSRLHQLLHPSSSPPFILLIFLGLAFFAGCAIWWYRWRRERNYKYQARAEAARVSDMQSRMEDYFQAFVAELKGFLTIPQANAVECEARYHPDFGSFEIWVRPVLGNFPNLDDQKQNTLQRIKKIERELSTQPFRAGTPRYLDASETASTLSAVISADPPQKTVCIPFSYTE